jgi:hypothetical protein
MAGTARDEAERLVAAVLAMAGSAGARDKVTAGLGALGETVAGYLGGSHDSGGSQNKDSQSTGSQSTGSQSTGSQRTGGQGKGGQGGQNRHQGGWATGSAECCVCPVCRVIAGMRDPSLETAVRLATGAGDLATGLTSVMRAFSAMTGERPRPKAPARPRPDSPDETWSATTRTANRPGDAWSAATNGRTADRSNSAAANARADRSGDTAANARAADRNDDIATTAGRTDSSAATTAGTDAWAATTAGTDAWAATTAGADAWAAATGVSATRAAAEHAAAVAAKAARRAAEQAAQREAAQAAARRAKEAAERVAEAVRLAAAARDLANGEGDPGVGATGARVTGAAGGARPEAAGGGSRQPGTARAAGGARSTARTARKLDVWAAATADAGVAAVGGGETLDHDYRSDAGQHGDDLSASAFEDHGDGVAGDEARRDGAV